MSRNTVPDPIPEAAYGLENWLSIELAAELFDCLLPSDEEWNISKEVEVIAATLSPSGISLPDIRRAWFNPDFKMNTTVRTIDNVVDEIELIKYKVAYELPDGSEVIQFRRQVNLPWKTSNRVLRGMISRPVAVIHCPSPEFPELLPYRFEVGLFRQTNEGKGFEYKQMKLEKDPEKLRGFANLLFRIVQDPSAVAFEQIIANKS